jgi:hypothetical protein
MARIKTCAMDTEYLNVRCDSRSMNETNDCTVVAISIVCGVSYEVAHNALKTHGRKDRQGAYRGTQLRAIESLGFHVASVYRHHIKEGIIAKYPAPHNTLQSATTHHPERFKKIWGALESNLLLFTKRHVSAYKDGVVKDWAKGKAKRVEEIWVVRKDKDEAYRVARQLGGIPY